MRLPSNYRPYIISQDSLDIFNLCENENLRKHTGGTVSGFIVNLNFRALRKKTRETSLAVVVRVVGQPSFMLNAET